MTRLREEVPVPQSNFQSFIHFVYQERIQNKIKDREKKERQYVHERIIMAVVGQKGVPSFLFRFHVHRQFAVEFT